jgi:prepilin-type N-terminal cleavage/methylation domain-containing protein
MTGDPVPARRRGPRCRRRSGVTLLELLVTLVVLAVVTGVVTVALPRITEPADDTPASRLASARREALATGRPVTITIEAAGGAVDATVAPDGSVVADTSLHFDRLAGRPRS